jgi:hypothetical protein
MKQHNWMDLDLVADGGFVEVARLARPRAALARTVPECYLLKIGLFEPRAHATETFSYL